MRLGKKMPGKKQSISEGWKPEQSACALWAWDAPGLPQGLLGLSTRMAFISKSSPFKELSAFTSA